MTVRRETSHGLLFPKPIRDRLWHAHPRLFIQGKQDSDGWSARRDAGASRPGPSEVEGTWHPDGGPSGRGGRARGRPFPLAAVGGRNMRCAKGGGVGVRPEGGAPPGVEGQRLCGLLKTLSRIASNRQTAARETVESAQH